MINENLLQNESIRLSNEEMLSVQGGNPALWELIKWALVTLGSAALAKMGERLGDDFYDYLESLFESQEQTEEEEQLYDGGEIEPCIVMG